MSIGSTEHFHAIDRQQIIHEFAVDFIILTEQHLHPGKFRIIVGSCIGCINLLARRDIQPKVKLCALSGIAVHGNFAAQ